MTETDKLQWNQETMERHLRSAMHALTPDVLERIDLNTPQEIYTGPSKARRLYRRLRAAGLAAAACLCVAALGGGVAGYQNRRVESVIGIDVNPSIELSVNRNGKVLKAVALNRDAEVILADMDLEYVDLDIAVNALIGSMVRNGYLTELDNAILVTVANDDSEKASVLRQDVVIDIEASLEAYQVEAVVYDQQAPEDDTVMELAEAYDISYGKAYFLQELVTKNNLTEEDMETFAGMTMEEIAREIAERSYLVREEEGETEASRSRSEHIPASREEEAETGGVEETGAESVMEETILVSESTEASQPEETAESVPELKPEENTRVPGSPAETESGAEEDETDAQADNSGKKARIDYVDYDEGRLDVVFKEKVKWKNPTVSIQDEQGQSYSAMITDTSSESCEIEVQGLPGGMECTFTLAGVSLREGNSYGSLRGYFETPEIAEGAGADEFDPEEEEEETEEEENPKKGQESVLMPDAGNTEQPETQQETEQEESEEEEASQSEEEAVSQSEEEEASQSEEEAVSQAKEDKADQTEMPE